MRSLLLALVLASCECRDPVIPVAGDAGAEGSIDPALRDRLAAALVARGPGYRPHTRHTNADGSPRFTNRLILETSPYLVQHAHNPVDWRPWGSDAFAEARATDRPLFVSIGYSTCHWCHVMADESFEDEAIAAVLNRDFIPVKVDREERPDVDAMYLAAVERMTGSAGWPLTVIVLPDGRPIFGGTYFPPRDGDRGRVRGIAGVLATVRAAYTTDRARLVTQADALVAALQRPLPPSGDLPDVALIRAATASLAPQFDATWGGFGRAPKFPRPSLLALLLRDARRSGDASHDPLAMATRTLERMAAGGLRDQVGGGFHRYAVDDKWRVPHFEKMLYDNAGLAVVYLEAAQATGRADLAAIARSTLDFLLAELATPDGFAAAIDADSAGGEGRYYVWTATELDRVLGDEAGRVVREYFDVTVGGNFEDGANILWQPQSLEAVAARLRLPAAEVAAIVEAARPKLAAARRARPYPHVDRKVIVGWNGLAIGALARGAFVLDEPRYLAAARTTAAHLLAHARRDGRLARGIVDGKAFGDGYLDDHAFLIAGLLDLAEVDPDPRWLREAIALQRVLDGGFADPRGGYFATGPHHERLAVRDRPDTDEALPSGNSIAAANLARLAELTGDEGYRATAERLFRALAPIARAAPASTPALLAALALHVGPTQQIVLVSPPGVEPTALLARLRGAFVPERVIVRVTDGETVPEVAALVEGKRALRGLPTAYVCRGTHCERPTTDPEVFAGQLLRAPGRLDR